MRFCHGRIVKLRLSKVPNVISHSGHLALRPENCALSMALDVWRAALGCWQVFIKEAPSHTTFVMLAHVRRRSGNVEGKGFKVLQDQLLAIRRQCLERDTFAKMPAGHSRTMLAKALRVERLAIHSNRLKHAGPALRVIHVNNGVAVYGFAAIVVTADILRSIVFIQHDKAHNNRAGVRLYIRSSTDI